MQGELKIPKHTKILDGEDRHLQYDLEKFKKFTGDIFPEGKCTAEHVKQINFGNCFLLASILSILSKGKEGEKFIKSMMKQYDECTIVRLFHPETLKPIYIKVSNTYFYQDENLQVYHAAPWVHVLEKAYAALAFKIENDNFKQSFAPFHAMHGCVDKETVALTMLSGSKSNKVKIHKNINLLWENIYLATNTFRNLEPLFNNNNQQHYKFNHELITELEEFFKTQDNNVFIESYQLLTHDENLQASDHFRKFINKLQQHNLPNEIKIKLEKIHLHLLIYDATNNGGIYPNTFERNIAELTEHMNADLIIQQSIHMEINNLKSNLNVNDIELYQALLKQLKRFEKHVGYLQLLIKQHQLQTQIEHYKIRKKEIQKHINKLVENLCLNEEIPAEIEVKILIAQQEIMILNNRIATIKKGIENLALEINVNLDERSELTPEKSIQTFDGNKIHLESSNNHPLPEINEPQQLQHIGTPSTKPTSHNQGDIISFYKRHLKKITLGASITGVIVAGFFTFAIVTQLGLPTFLLQL